MVDMAAATDTARNQTIPQEAEMQYMDKPAPLRAPTLILVHGSWHTGSCWSRVQRELTAAGVPSTAPTLTGHGPADDRSRVTHDDYVASVISALDDVSGTAVLVGHSFGGSVISRVAELRPERCQGLVYCSAFVPGDGESVADSLPAEFVEFLEQAATAREDRAIELPDSALRDGFANTADKATLARIRALLVPEPYEPIFETLALPRFTSLRIPTVYISCRDDRTMPPGTFHPGQSSRLAAPTVIEIDGDHESLFTAPERLADALLEAVDVIQTTASARPQEMSARVRS
jgi:pimeloyl-ACP methyl ester carboxylesterase